MQFKKYVPLFEEFCINEGFFDRFKKQEESPKLLDKEQRMDIITKIIEHEEGSKITFGDFKTKDMQPLDVYPKDKKGQTSRDNFVEIPRCIDGVTATYLRKDYSKNDDSQIKCYRHYVFLWFGDKIKCVFKVCQESGCDNYLIVFRKDAYDGENNYGYNGEYSKFDQRLSSRDVWNKLDSFDVTALTHFVVENFSILNNIKFGQGDISKFIAEAIHSIYIGKNEHGQFSTVGTKYDVRK